jgi:signal peptidase II
MANPQREDSLSLPNLTRLGLAIAVAVFALDQAVKVFLLRVVDMPARKSIALTPFFDLRMAWNEGVSYGFLTTHVQGVLIALSLAITAFLLRWLWRAQSPLSAWSLGLIIGGALSNALDRATYGAVADFFYFHLDGLNFALLNFIFNPADIAIVAGVALLLYESAFDRKPA